MSDFADLDYEEIDDTVSNETSSRPDDFMTIIVDQAYNFDWFMILAVAIAFLVVVSNTFNDHVIKRMPGGTRNGELTTRGYMIQLISLLIGSILVKIFFSII